MPKITNAKVLAILQDPYFDHHVAMHLGRERLVLPNGDPEPLFLPSSSCDDCAHMTEVGKPGSGREFLQMHHEMIRVFRFLLEHHDLKFFANWEDGAWHQEGDPGGESYAPLLWNLDDPGSLPHEIVGMLNVTDPDFLGKVFAGVKDRTGRNPNFNVDCRTLDDAVDKLGMFIERGIDRKANPNQVPDGSGFHNTMHEFLASREGKAAQGAEMNKLRNSMFNDYFWSLHLWIDGQYGRLLEHCGQGFNSSGLDPMNAGMLTHGNPHGKATGMSMP
ncbi:MAG: hypothetical protein LAQ69_45420 [Acidobacteriia bacterium]|nr:hypothetical protein [Terriglobia bacterium]